LAFASAAARRGGAPAAFGAACGTLAAGLLVETAPGGGGLGGTVLGYSLSLGARYYGVGNEWMGAITGLALAALFTTRVGANSRGRVSPAAGAAALLLLVAAI